MENLYRCYMTGVARVFKALRGLDYALYKFRKPVEHVSVDIDILVRYEHLLKSVKALVDMGFRVEVLELYTVTMVIGETIVDLCTHPSFAWVMCLDDDRLLEEVEIIELDSVGVKVRAMSREAEAVATVAHVVYEEHVYLLSDYYVVREWFNRRVLSLARKLIVENAVEAALKLDEEVEKGLVKAPVKLSPAQVAVTLVWKFVEDPGFRATVVNTPRLVARRRIVQQLIWKIMRKTY
ncbi:MAG: hypothetical protein QXS63_04540 [Zestosphaera sp.]